MDFILGCNYWASNAGADMWRCFDANAIEKDIKTLSEYGITHIRAFPNWRDFQPVIPLKRSHGVTVGYCLESEEKCENNYYISDLMLKRFSVFLDICEKNKIFVIVGLITGWMSGRLYLPPVLLEKNVICDATAQYFEQLFIKGFVSEFKNRNIITAWDLGNECNCMAQADRINAANWTGIISNAIKAVDNTRPILSGMDGLYLDRYKSWQLKDQAMFTDVLTTHPYPYWVEFASVDEILSIRTTMHATAQTKLFSEVGGKPCLAEELGTMGPMICSDENAAKFLRLNMFSLWANGACGAMWWCANEQTMLSKFPYSENTCELELGMLRDDHSPKPVILEMKKFSDFLKNKRFELPAAEYDCVCILTHDQSQWGVGYMTYVLLRNAGLNLKFAFCDGDIPMSKLYLMPSVNGKVIMEKSKLEELLERIKHGADLYISIDDTVLPQFDKLCGARVTDSFQALSDSKITLDDKELDIRRKRTFILEKTSASVIAYDSESNPAVTVNKYGEGRVFYVNFPLENMLTQKHNAFKDNYSLVYKKLFREYIEAKPIKIYGENLVVTYHQSGDDVIAVIINHSNTPSEFKTITSEDFYMDGVYYGSFDKVNAFDACVLRFKKK